MDRTPIQTYVSGVGNEEMIWRPSTGSCPGSVRYYAYNRVTDIDEANRVVALVPEAVVHFAHGQICASTSWSGLAADFINGEIDVLVSTTIIETGLDIPNANTMIVHDADRMGSSQLYHQPGRWAFQLDLPSRIFDASKRDKLLKEEAEKRLQAIREFTELAQASRSPCGTWKSARRGKCTWRAARPQGVVATTCTAKMLNEAVPAQRARPWRVYRDHDIVGKRDINAHIPPLSRTNTSWISTSDFRHQGDEYMDMQDERPTVRGYSEERRTC